MVVPSAVVARAREIARACTPLAPIDAEELLGGRAALLGLTNGERISAGGATRLLAGDDGCCALTLSRPDDIDAVPALVESDSVGADPWPFVERRVRTHGAASVAARAILLGLPVGLLGETPPAPPVVAHVGARAQQAPLAKLLVADLSSMWAGPLCGRLLARAGATVVKVESQSRPDGTRAGPTQFFDWMNSGKYSYAVDFAHPGGLRALLGAADVVVESSRPAALHRRGLGPADLPPRPGRIWVRITGHGAEGAAADRVAFGDDAAVSGGLACGTSAFPRFCGDAIADPLTGLQAAHALLQSRERGGGELVTLSMAAVAATYADLPRDAESDCAATPSAVPPAAPLGADNDTVDRLVAERLAPC